MSVNIPKNNTASNNQPAIPQLPAGNVNAPVAQPVGGQSAFGQAAPMYTSNQPQPNGNQTSGVTEKQHPYLSYRQLTRNQTILSRAPVAEVVKKFRESVDKFSKATLERNGIAVLELNATDAIKISALIIVVQEPGGSAGSRIAYHTVLLGSSMTATVSQDYTIDRIQFTRVGLPTDAWEETTRMAVRDIVQQRYPNRQLIDSAASCIPESFDYNDETAIRLVILNATNAAKAQLWKCDPGATYLSIGVNFTGSFRSEIKTGWENQVNIYGSPVRSDIVLELYDTTTESKNKHTNDPEAFRISDPDSAQLVSNITGYIDLVWSPVNFNPAAMYGANFQGQIPEFGPYVPRFIITQMDQLIGTDIVSMLFSLATTAALKVVNDNCLKLIIKQHENGARNAGNDGLDIRDLGGLGYDSNPNDVNSALAGQAIKTSDLMPGSPELVSLVRSLIRTRELTIAMDVEECGPSSWAQGIFFNAAMGDNAAYKEIINAANVLTNNKFANYFKSGVICYDDNYRVNLGYYLDGKGIRRDIRDVDLLAMFNVYGKSNVLEARDWSNHQSDNSSNMYLRSALSRDKIKNTLVKPVFEGYARRLTMDTNFIDALAAGIKEAGMSFQSTMDSSNPLGGLRATLPWLQSMVHTTQGAGAFTQRRHFVDPNQNHQNNQFNRIIGVGSGVSY